MSTKIVSDQPGSRFMDNLAARRLVETIADGEERRAQLRRELEDFAAELAGPSGGPIERVLAETAALAWFAHRMYEAGSFAPAGSRGGLTRQEAEYLQRCIDKAHRRLVTTLKALAQVRKLALPAIQVNIAKRQLNVAGNRLGN